MKRVSGEHCGVRRVPEEGCGVRRVPRRVRGEEGSQGG